MKSIISIFLVLVVCALCFFGCSNIPDEPATTEIVKHSYVNPIGETVAPPENLTEGDTSVPVQYVETINNIEFVISSYHVYNNNVGAITDITLEDDGFSTMADGYAKVRIDAIGSRKSMMKIAYIAYDANGEIVRHTYLQAKLDGVKKGETVENCRFDFPRETVKIVFYDYVDNIE